MTQYLNVRVAINNQANDNDENQSSEDDIEVAARAVAINIDDNIDIRALSNEYDNTTSSTPGYISHAIKHIGKNVQYAVTFLDKTPKTPGIFFLKMELLKGFTGKYHDGFKLAGVNYTISKEWVTTIQKIGRRRDPHGDVSVYRRVGRNDSFAEVLMYITTYPGDLPYDRIVEDQKKIGDVIWKDVWGNPSRMKNIGKIIVNDAKEKGGGMIEWILTNKGGENKSEDEAAKKISKDIVDNFKNGVTWKTHITLDHFFVDYDMMEFLTKTAGFTSWNDFTESEKHVCYKNYPNKVLPDWSKLVKETYNGSS